MNQTLEKPELVKDTIPADQQRLLVVLAENAALSGFSNFMYSVSIDDLCRKLNLNGTKDENLTVLHSLIKETKRVFFCFANLYYEGRFWSSKVFESGSPVFTDDALVYEYMEEMMDYFITFCHDGVFDGEAFLSSDFPSGIQLPGHPVTIKL